MMADDMDLIRRHIRDVPDFPKPGILFKDISPLLASPDAFEAVITLLEQGVVDLCPRTPGTPRNSLKLVALDARGFLFGAPVSMGTLRPLVMARKPGKLPGELVSIDYGLEYGNNTLTMQADSILPGDQVVIVDDLLATGGTAKAAADLVVRMGGTVLGCVFVVELTALPGRKTLEDAGYPVRAVVGY